MELIHSKEKKIRISPQLSHVPTMGQWWLGWKLRMGLLVCAFPIKANVITAECLTCEYQIFTLNIQYGTIPWRDHLIYSWLHRIINLVFINSNEEGINSLPSWRRQLFIFLRFIHRMDLFLSPLAMPLPGLSECLRVCKTLRWTRGPIYS